MTTLRPALLLIILLGLQANAAAFQAWMKQPDPAVLAYVLLVSSQCPFERWEAAEVIEGAFVRSRIKPLDALVAGSKAILGGDEDRTMAQLDLTLFLNVAITCVLPRWGGVGKSVWHIDLGWAVVGEPLMRYYEPIYGKVGIGDSSFILDALSKEAESALVDYLKANFSL